MLRLYDARSGHVTDVLSARPGRLVIRVADSADLRGQIVADVLRRLSERQRLRVFLFSGQDAAPLNVRPGLAGDASGADLTVGEISPDGARGDKRTLDLGPTADALPDLAAIHDRGLDPLALRLVALRAHYRDTLSVTWDDLTEATADLAAWRAEVASWARSPGRPLSTAYAAEAEAALCADLDVTAALRVLRQLAEDPAVDPGTKFETTVHLDLILALDLVSTVGT